MFYKYKNKRDDINIVPTYTKPPQIVAVKRLGNSTPRTSSVALYAIILQFSLVRKGEHTLCTIPSPAVCLDFN